MSKKEQQVAAAVSAFNRASADDWEVIASEQYEENQALTEQIKNLKNELDNQKSSHLFVDPKRCRNWIYSDRNSFEMGDIDDLAEDIKQNGQLQPAIVRRINELDYDFEIIAGERRWRACKLVNIDLLAIETKEDDAGCVVIQTSENKKKSLSAYSLSKTYKKLMDDLVISQNELAKRLAIPKSSFANLMAFNNVPDKVWNAVEDMSLVKPRTAAFLSSLCSKGDEYISAIEKVADKIRQGTGADNLKKHIDKYLSNVKTNRNASKVYKNGNGEVIFRITSEGRVTFSKHIKDKVNFDDLALVLESFIDKM